jgi:hypothetical protein
VHDPHGCRPTPCLRPVRGDPTTSLPTPDFRAMPGFAFLLPVVLLLLTAPSPAVAQTGASLDRFAPDSLAQDPESSPMLGSSPLPGIHPEGDSVPEGEGEEALRGDDEDFLHVGGAVRFNLLSEFYEGDRDPNSTQFTWDTWRINVQGQTGGVGIQFEYRFYPTFNTHFIKEGWLQYDFSEETQIQVGVPQTPFGNVQYNSHNWWFQLPYYVGLEDDHDMGFKVSHHRAGGWNLDLAYFLQPEPSGPAYGEASFGIGGAGRYSYDMIPVQFDDDSGEIDQSNQEKHQGNLRLTRTMEYPGGGSTEFGGSVQFGGIYNSALDEWGNRWGWAVHSDGTYGPWNVKLQFLQYGYDAIDDTGADTDLIWKGAYGDPYHVAAEAWIATAGVQYTMDMEWGPFTQINFYDNYSYMEKWVEDFHPTHQNVLGFSIAAGGLFTYFDLATGRNHPWLTESFGTGLGPGLEDASWNHRFNVNVGYYF